MAGQLAIEFHRHILLAGYAQVPGLKIFDFRDTNIRAEHDMLQILNDLQITQTSKGDYIQQPIVDDGMLEKRKWTSVQAAIADEDK